jgi:hypothetical protein
METKKAKGNQGNWFATIDGESLPCLHQYFWTGKNKYKAQIRNESHFIRMKEFALALEDKGRAVLTIDDISKNEDGHICFARKGYIAVYEIKDVSIDESYLRLTFTNRLFNLH